MPIECDETTARERLADAGLEIHQGNSDHERWRVEYVGATAVAYDGKVVVQGEGTARLEALLRGTDGGRVHAYFDGASRKSRASAIGWAIVNSEGIVGEGSETIGETTNNRAEYEALIRALEAADEYGFDEVDVRGDSELIVKQVHGEYDTNNPELRERRVRVRELLTTSTLAARARSAGNKRPCRRLANDALDDD